MQGGKIRLMDEKELIRKWIETWAVAGKELEAIKRRELEAMTDNDVREHVHALFTGWYPPDEPPNTESGLVEQQRWFAKLHRRK
jgi:hypothetical protein